MTSTSFTFDEADPPISSESAAGRGVSSPFLLPSGELDFDAYVDVSPPGGRTGGDDVIMSDTVDLLNRIDTSDGSQGAVLAKLVRVSSSSINNMCRGSIGGSNGLRFCIKSNCATASHKHKVDITECDEDRYYIGGVRGSQAYTEPCIPVKWIPQPLDQAKIESMEKPLSVWKLFFKRLGATANDGGGKQATKNGFQAIKELADIDAAKEYLKTPKRPAPINLIDMMVDTAMKIQTNPTSKKPKLVRFENFVKSEDSAESKLLQLELILDQWNELVDQIESVQITQGKRGTDDNTFKEKCIQTICELQDSLHKSEDMGRLLQEDMGVAAKELDGMTVWEAIEKLVYDTTNLSKTWDETKLQFADISTVMTIREEIQKCKTFIMQMKASFNTFQAESGHRKQIEQNLIKFKEHYMKFYTQVQQVLLNQGSSNNTAGPSNVRFQFNLPKLHLMSTER